MSDLVYTKWEGPIPLNASNAPVIQAHTFIRSGNAQRYWGTITTELEDILGDKIPMDPKFVLLGISTDVDLPRKKLILANLDLVVAKRDLTCKWGTVQ